MATYNEELRCFQHCSRNVDLICFMLPEVCPLCLQPTATTESRIPPYVLPSPFSSSLNYKRSIVLKPTFGDFIRSYSRACNLHIGITDRNGVVCDYDEKGLNQGSVWPECLLVLSCVPNETDFWDQTLENICQHLSNLWSGMKYHENNWNCFDFVLSFLRLFNHPDFSRNNLLLKEEFCNNYLVKKTLKAEQYIHIYRQALQSGCVVIPKKSS